MRQAPLEVPRRGVLAVAGAAAVSLSTVACTAHDDDSAPDPLLALADAAEHDAATAEAIHAKFGDVATATEVAAARRAQARALRKEIDRAAGARGTRATRSAERDRSERRGHQPRIPSGKDAALKALSDSIEDAGHKAGELVPTLPRYRAGLVGSVAAGCASLVEVLS